MSKKDLTPKEPAPKNFFDKIADQAAKGEVVPLQRIECPACHETDRIDTQSTQYALLRECQKCGQKWSGMLVIANPEVYRPEDTDAFEPLIQNLNGPHRDPGNDY